MMSGMYAAISGLDAHQTMLDVTANNLANVDTVGYKAQSTVFADELSQLIAAGTGPNGYSAGTNPVQVGLGVQIGSIENVMTAGGVQSTGNVTDVNIQGDGFLQVANGNPTVNTSTTTTNQSISTQPEYTRAGDLTFNSQGFLCTQTGQYVLGYLAQPVTGGYSPVTTGTNPAQNAIYVPTGSTGISISKDGAVSYVDGNASSPTYQQRVTAGYISLATFPNEAGLQREGGSLWSTTSASGAVQIGQPGIGNFGQTISGQLEQSNVDMGHEFTNMIEAERGYQANASTITTADQMMQTAVQMKQ
jgi:flagellar hook protein FlgE